MSSNNSIEKIYGQYYTPARLAQAITDWAINIPNLNVLDPAFSRGAFLKAALKSIERIEKRRKIDKLYGIEIEMVRAHCRTS